MISVSSEHLEIPAVDFSVFNDWSGISEKEKIDFVKDSFAPALSKYGFVHIENHGVPGAIEQSLQDQLAKFFFLPEDLKIWISSRLLMQFRKQTGKGKNRETVEVLGLLKQDFASADFSQMSRKLDEYEFSIETFLNSINSVMNERYAVSQKILKSLAIYIGLQENHFERLITSDNAQMNLMNYLPFNKAAHDSALRTNEGQILWARPHIDRSLVTVLRSKAGLVIKDRNNYFSHLKTHGNAYIANIGLHFQVLTNGQILATEHAVVTTDPKRRRLQVAHFTELPLDYLLQPTPCAIDKAGGQNNYPVPKTVGEVREIGSSKFLQLQR